MPGQASQASANASSSVLPTELTQQLQRLQPVPEQVQELQTKVQEQERVLKGLVRLMLQKGFCSPTELTTSFEPAKNPSSGSSKLSMPPVITPSHAGAPSTPFQPIRLMTSASPHEKSNVLIISRAALQKMATKNISSDLAKAVEVLKNEHKGVHGGLSLAKALLEDRATTVSSEDLAAGLLSVAQFLARQDGSKKASKEKQSRASKYEQKVKVEAEDHEEENKEEKHGEEKDKPDAEENKEDKHGEEVPLEDKLDRQDSDTRERVEREEPEEPEVPEVPQQERERDRTRSSNRKCRSGSLPDLE